MPKYQIFISYRRDGGDHFAARLSDKLSVAGYKVFFDIESMRAGLFNEQIYSAIDECDDVLLILPKDGLDRCIDEEDWVRKEIEYSILKKKNIIPIMLRDFTFPENLPDNLKVISMSEGIMADTHYFDAMINRIQDLMKSKPCLEKNEEDRLKNGIRFLNRKMYKQAISCFEEEIEKNISNPEAYFYAAVAMMEGKRPFLVNKAVINNIESYIESAIAYEERPIFYCLYAYLKYDYYAKKMLKTSPTYKELLLLAVSMNLSSKEVDSLFELLKVDRPSEFY